MKINNTHTPSIEVDSRLPLLEGLREVIDDNAKCKGLDPSMFIEYSSGSKGEVVRTCGRCVVRQECLDYAVLQDEEYGIWGGMTRPERLRYKRNNNNKSIIAQKYS